MDVAATSYSRRASLGLVRWLLTGTFAVLGALILVIFAHAATANSSLLLPITILATALAVGSFASVVAGTLYAWSTYHQHRGVILFLVVITAATLFAHAYIIGAPALDVSRSATGQVGTTVSSDNLKVDVKATGPQLQVTATADGGDAVANINVTANGQSLSGAGFSPNPTLASPLLSGSTVTGLWNLPSGEANTTISVSYLDLTCFANDKQTYGCIMDEVYYVPAAQHMLAGVQCQLNVASSDPHYCNPEHPFLGKALIAAGMAMFGEYSVVGWRIMPALLGTFSIPLLFGVAWKLSGSKKIASFAALLLALDVMFFSQGSGGMIDDPVVFFALAGFLAYAADLKVWRFDRYVLAGVFLGLAGLVKETAIFLVLGMMTYVLIFDEGRKVHRAYSALKVALVVVLVFTVSMQAYDSTMAQNALPTVVQHIGFMLSYGSSLLAKQLACQPTTGYWCEFANDPGGAPILPPNWVLYYSPVAYYSVTNSVCPNTVNGVCQGGQYSYVALAYYGVTNFLETWTVFIWVPLIAFALYRYFRNKQPKLDEFGFEAPGVGGSGLPGDVRLGAFALVWFLWAYLPYFALLAVQRVTYPFYIIPAIPAIALGCAYWVTRDWFPKWLRVVYLVMVFVFFFVYFPEKGFLPDWLRVLIGH